MKKILQVGDKMPPFSGVDQYGKEHNSTEFENQKLVVFFYPKASTPGCTAEACNINDNLEALHAQGYQVIGVSADSVEKQRKFSDKYDFKFPIIADVDRQIIDAFGVWGEKKFMGRTYDGIHRVTFIINENGVVERVIEKVKTKDHANQILNSEK
ncbi:thioredoxin-dependent thiol peroxidase [Ornithobacterium rhinotracheale]|uniref:thioredoxin-dependent peroxiredoxin n=1 Tax=Ornithobacterium rhinotracheale TaxID=28251 RepID=A0A3R5UWR9_ORNRH|nr:thioredoxin-dependent thiol peroxidase [Ornithobacterium rhinotracheale]QAR31629.1 thioredoxin-dependent thiol peroxidase [Ornithobacterium rhinotracheale]